MIDKNKLIAIDTTGGKHDLNIKIDPTMLMQDYEYELVISMDRNYLKRINH